MNAENLNEKKELRVEVIEEGVLKCAEENFFHCGNFCSPIFVKVTR